MCPNPQFPADLVTLTEEILNGKFQFLCSIKFASLNADIIVEFLGSLRNNAGISLFFISPQFCS